jgi:ERCC4-type nuclease
MSNALTAVKNHLSNHHVRYGVAVVATMAAAKTVQIVREWKEFADEHGVTEALKSPAEKHDAHYH